MKPLKTICILILFQWGELFQGFYTQKIKRWVHEYKYGSFFVADKMRLGTVFVQHKKNVYVYQNLIQQTVNSVRTHSCWSWICCPIFMISKLRESNYIFRGCLVSGFNIFVQLVFTLSQSKMFRATITSMHFITVSGADLGFWNGGWIFVII